MKSDDILVRYATRTFFGTILSRIVGYMRDVLVSSLFGTGMLSDAFYVAFRIPNLLRRIFGEGAFSSAFVPIFNEYLHRKSKEETQEFLNIVFAVLLLTLVTISILGMFYSSFLAKIVAGGFSNEPEKIQLVINLTRMMFPFVTFICLTVFLLAILNALNSFFIPSLTPAIISSSEIIYILAVAPLFAPNKQIKGLVVSIVIGGMLCFFVQYPKLKSLGWRLNFKLNLKHPAVVKILFLMIPSIIGLSADQVNALVDSRYASSLGQGAVSAIYYANRLMQMPLGVFGFAIATALLPILSKAYIQRDIVAFKKSFNYSIRLSNFVLIPASIGFMFIGLPIVKFLFEYGKFNASSSIMTNNALFYYSLGLPAYALVRIFANAFYSFQDTKTPVKVAVEAIGLHVILGIILMHSLGLGGLALATTISSYINFILLAVYLKKYVGKFELKQIVFSFLKSLFASFISGIVALYVCRFSDKLFIAVPCAIISSLIVFITVSYIFKSEELMVIHKMLKKNLDRIF
ncbi:MAG: murein biosynthesis integral membrane protein MurJ [Endomicrobium sp.]|jgi:putative peptidoglycan lipid II flippase|nr:murein biosynthesis integral membrane protein MurJ [Endomicrobium sp.]